MIYPQRDFPKLKKIYSGYPLQDICCNHDYLWNCLSIIAGYFILGSAYGSHDPYFGAPEFIFAIVISIVIGFGGSFIFFIIILRGIKLVNEKINDFFINKYFECFLTFNNNGFQIISKDSNFKDLDMDKNSIVKASEFKIRDGTEEIFLELANQRNIAFHYINIDNAEYSAIILHEILVHFDKLI